MYTMKADGVVFYDTSSDDMAYQVLSPKAKYELNKSGSLTFTMLPGNVLYDGLHKMKTVVTLEQDGREIFRGRVLETTSDLYNQKEVHCEGELSYLLDSLQRPYEYEGSAIEFFIMLVNNHNEQVEEYKRFTVGMVTALTEEDKVDTKSGDYGNTLDEIKRLLVSEFDGYLRVRYEDGIRYLDYIDEYNTACEQVIEFGVNLVDIENTVDAVDVFTVLVPLGKTVSGKALTVESVNGGLDYIEDEEAIAQYGRIVKSKTWSEIEDAQELLEKGREHFGKMKAETSLTITALDLHNFNVDVDSIDLGDMVKLLSAPHWLDKEDICTVIELAIDNPEKSVYTFGKPHETLTDSTSATSKDSDHWHIHLTETEYALEVFIESVNEDLSNVKLRCDGLDSSITMMADQIKMKANTVRVEALEMEIQGLLKASELEAAIAELGEVAINTLSASTVDCTTLAAHGASSVDGDLTVSGELYCNGLAVNGVSAEWKSTDVVYGGSVNVTRTLSPYFYDSAGNLTTIAYVTDATFVPKTKTISYLGV